MFKHLVAAREMKNTQPLYFAGYKDDGLLCETIWTNDYWQAKWFDAGDAETEAMLLAIFCPSYQVEAWQICDASTWKK
ncbi:hypothetical protein ACFQS7_25385 [Dankookia sp. GCM10030260]|uniref:hypothetical protein n=1 Tax=Dankookia sp. GCM10030260 TaxID=3273390 RepID=UPI0036102A45